MKKSPWKFLVGLASRRRHTSAGEVSSAPTSDSEISPDKETDLGVAGEGSPAPSAVPPDDQQTPALAEAPDSSAADDDLAGAAGVQSRDGEQHASALAGDTQIGSVTKIDTYPPVEPKAMPPKVPRRRGPGRGKNGGDLGTTRVDPDPVTAGPTVPADSPFLEQMANLDEEVQLLRSHLTDKLRMQNEQLRRMLERFDRAG